MEFDIILVTGARDFPNYAAVEYAIVKMKLDLRDGRAGHELLVITGGAPGADQMAKIACDKNDIHCAVMSALWSTRHRSAGPQRNKAMLWLVGVQRLSLALAFHDNLPKSKGTKDMCNELHKAHVPVYLYNSEGYGDILNEDDRP